MSSAIPNETTQLDELIYPSNISDEDAANKFIKVLKDFLKGAKERWPDNEQLRTTSMKLNTVLLGGVHYRNELIMQVCKTFYSDLESMINVSTVNLPKYNRAIKKLCNKSVNLNAIGVYEDYDSLFTLLDEVPIQHLTLKFKPLYDSSSSTEKTVLIQTLKGLVMFATKACLGTSVPLGFGYPTLAELTEYVSLRQSEKKRKGGNNRKGYKDSDNHNNNNNNTASTSMTGFVMMAIKHLVTNGIVSEEGYNTYQQQSMEYLHGAWTVPNPEAREAIEKKNFKTLIAVFEIDPLNILDLKNKGDRKPTRHFWKNMKACKGFHNILHRMPTNVQREVISTAKRVGANKNRKDIPSTTSLGEQVMSACTDDDMAQMASTLSQPGAMRDLKHTAKSLLVSDNDDDDTDDTDDDGNTNDE